MKLTSPESQPASEFQKEHGALLPKEDMMILDALIQFALEHGADPMVISQDGNLLVRNLPPRQMSNN